jgi:hypothetical protein
VRNKKRLVLAILAVGVCLSVLAPRADAQVLYGSIVGAVTDSSGASVPGATVTIVNTQTNLTRTAVSNETGTYSFTNVLPGPYDVKVSLQGFKELVRTGVPVSINQVSRVDLVLELGALTETVTVESQSSLLQTDKAGVHNEIKSAAIVNSPLGSYRNYQSLLNLVPGATPATFQNSEVDTPGRSLRTFINGQNPNNNTTKTDGATNVNIWLPHHVMYVSPAETVDTVSVSTASFDAEQGNAGGAAITVITKSGTNEFKGSAFEFYNSDKLNARPYFNTKETLAPGVPVKTPASAHIGGGTLGGPVLKNRLFFFGSWEGQYQRNDNVGFWNVPPAALRNGDFSQAFNADGSLQIIYNPFTGNPDGTGRQPFEGNRIPQELISRIALQVQDLFPMPNTTGSTGANVGGASITRNFTRIQQRKFDRNNYDFKVNWNPSSAQQVWGKFSMLDANVGNLWKLGYDDPGNGDTRVYQYGAGTTWTMNSTTVFDATIGISRMNQTVTGGDFGLGNYGRDTLGIPGTNGGRLYGDDPRYAGLPSFITGFSTLGNDDGWNPVERHERTYAFAGNMTKLRGAHEFRVGYSVNRLALDHWQPELGSGPRGALTFNPNATALPGGTAGNQYNAYAAMLLGLVGSPSGAQVVNTGESVQYEEMTGREWQHGLYARDRWQVGSKMTLDIGLRYEYYPLMTRANRGIETVDLNSLEVLLGGLGSNPKDLGIKVSKTLFAPRLGMVYRISDNSVARVGYGRTFNPLPFSRPLRGFYPLTISGTFVPLEQYGWVTTFAQGIPDIVGPDLSSGRIPLPNNYDMRFPENDVSRGHIDSWNLAYERRLPWDISVDTAYVGTRGRDGFADLNINAAATPGGGVASQPLFETFGRRISLLSWGPRTRTDYHALQVSVNRPFKHGLLLKGAYTLSRAKNETDEDGWAGLNWNTPSELGRNYALAGYDRTHMFQMAFVYELPYKATGDGNRVMRAILGDWQTNWLYSAYSGTPFTITADGGVLNMPGNLQVADKVGDYKQLDGKGSAGVFFDTSAFAQPTGVRFGNTGRNQFRGPGQWNLDLSLVRGFRLGGSRRLDFRSEFFNITNTPKWRSPLGTTQDPNIIGGTISVTNANFGRNFNVSGERQIRLGARLSF